MVLRSTQPIKHEFRTKYAKNGGFYDNDWLPHSREAIP